MKRKKLVVSLLVAALFFGLSNISIAQTMSKPPELLNVKQQYHLLRPGEPVSFSQRLVAAAIELTADKVVYDGSYRKLSYPMGDVPKDRGVCTDVVIRAYRKLGLDLQKDVHEDMKVNFAAYPAKWGLKRPDSNIDHRRVPNLQMLFSRKGKVMQHSAIGANYLPGDLVTWALPGNLPHIGIVSDRKSADGLRPLIVHNIGAGQVIEDMLFSYRITGHYRYYGQQTKETQK